MVTMKSRTKTAQVFNLPCPGDCKPGETCFCNTIRTELREELPDGTKGVRVLERRLPGSVTFLAGETKELPDWVARCPDVKGALDRGSLRLIER